MSLRPSIAPPGDRDGNLDRVEFYGRDADGRVMRIVTKLDDVGNVYADLSEVTVLTGEKKNNLPPLMSLREVVEAAQERDALPTVNAESIPNSGANGNLAKFAVRPSALGDGKQKYYEVPFGTAVDKIVKAKKPIGREAVFVSATPKPLQEIGLARLPVMMNQDHVLSCYYDVGEGVSGKHLHGLHLQLKSLPNALECPLMIIASESGNAGSGPCDTVHVIRSADLGSTTPHAETVRESAEPCLSPDQPPERGKTTRKSTQTDFSRQSRADSRCPRFCRIKTNPVNPVNPVKNLRAPAPPREVQLPNLG